MKKSKNPKITIEVLDNKWLVTNHFNEEVKVFVLWHQLENYIKQNITMGGK